MNQALPLTQKLAGNPAPAPRYAVAVKNSAGESISVMDPKATRALISLMDMNAVLGGAASHYGGPAAFAELMSALHGYVFTEAKKQNKPWFELFHLVNDAGHCENGLYALKAAYGFAGLNIEKLKKFRSIDSRLTGHGESHLFPEGVFLSNGPLGSAFPQSQGVAMADAAAKNSRVTVTAISDGACMEGEAREAMAAIPGLARAGKVAPYVLIISDNNTKLSGRIDKESFSMQPTFQALKSLGWKVIDLMDGHDLQKCFSTIEKAVAEARANPQEPIAIHARTIKGIGTKKTAESSSGGHGFPLKSPTELPEFLKEIYDGQSYPQEFTAWIDELLALEKEIKAKAVKPAQPEEKIQTGISSAMIKAAKAGLPVVSVSSDLAGSTGVAGFRKEFPQASFDVGVAESNMISVAAGFSKMGYIPVVDTFAQFGVTKGALPLIMSSLSEAPMICVFSHTGFQDAADGASHQALSYLAMTSSLQYVDVYCLTCSEEAEQLMTLTMEKFAADRKAGKHPVSTVFFLGRENFPKTYVTGAKYDLQKAQIVSETTGSNLVTIVASGSMMPQALLASAALKAANIGAVVVNPGCHNKVDTATLRQALKKSEGRMVTVEDHQLIGGLGQMIAHALSLEGISFRLKSLAVHGEFGQSAYSALDLYQKHHLDEKAIVHAARELL
jgi:transketolase